MTDVHDLLARTQRALGEAESPLDAPVYDTLVDGVRRRRRRRHAGEALGVVAVAVALGASGWLGLHRGGTTQPAQSPPPTVAPSPSVDPTRAADAARAPDAPGLQPALVLPPDVLDAAGPGWVLTTQRPTAATDDGSAAPTAQVVDLVDPAGTRYRVADLPLDRWVQVVHWVADAGWATVVVSGDDGQTGARLDLRTGALTPVEGLPPVSTYVGRAGLSDVWDDSPGNRLLVHSGASTVRELPGVEDALLSPSGTLVAGTTDAGVVLVDVATGSVRAAAPPGDDLCRPMAWRAAQLLVSCEGLVDGAPTVTAVLAVNTQDPTAGPQPVDLGAGPLPVPTGGTLSDGRVAVPHTRDVECARGWGVLDVDAGTLTSQPVPGDDPAVTLTAAGDVVLVTVGGQCSGDGGPVRVLRHDVPTGTEIEIAPVPPDTDLPAGTTTWLTATTSTVLATPR